MQPYEQHAERKLAATLATIFVVAGVIVGVDHYRSEHSAVVTTSSAPTSTSTSTSPDTTNSSSSGAGGNTPNSSTSTPSSTPSSGYKDGSYSASSTYYVPHGSESIKVSLTLAGGTITDVSIQNSENDFTSQQYQESFASSYKSYVVGQKISGLQLYGIAGASDTTQGFNDALSQIASQAQA